MKYLYTTCGTQFQVSDVDEIFLAGFNWSLAGAGYIRGTSGKYRNRYLHHVIAKRMGLECPNEVDHKDGNPLNNQRDNLRPATHIENMRNVKLSVRNTSGCKGVSWNKALQKWKAYIRVNKKLIHLGYFDNYEEACRIREEAEIKYFEEFRRGEND